MVRTTWSVCRHLLATRKTFGGRISRNILDYPALPPREIVCSSVPWIDNGLITPTAPMLLPATNTTATMWDQRKMNVVIGDWITFQIQVEPWLMLKLVRGLRSRSTSRFL